MRQVVVEVQCARCERKETRKWDAAEKEPPPALIATLCLGVVPDVGAERLDVRFDDLCAPCYRSVKGLLEQVSKRIEGVSPDRVSRAPKDAKDEAPSSTEAKKADPAPPPAPGPRSQLAAPAVAKATGPRAS